MAPRRRYLEYQADRVESVLAAHRSPGRITGGTVGPRLIRFFLNPAPQTRYAAIKRLADDLALAMRVPNLHVNRGEQGVVLEFANPEPSPVSLLPLIQEVDPVPLATATLGLTDDGVPLLARLSSPDVAHVLVAGTTGSGKSVLLRTLILSLAMAHSPTELRFLCIDPKGRAFTPFKHLPHLLRHPIVDPNEALEALTSAVRTMEIRDRLNERPVTPLNRDDPPHNAVPRIVIVVDELADLLMLGEKPMNKALTRLVQRGREAGMHIVAATQRPSSAILGGVMRANFPLRLVGKVASTDDARVAAGRGGTDAHLLGGRGDFLAITGQTEIRFQVANVDDKTLQQQVKQLHPVRMKALAI